MERGVLTGISLLRDITFVWMAVVLAGQEHYLSLPVLAWVLVAATGVVTVGLAILGMKNTSALLKTPLIGAELALGILLMLLDGVVYRHGHVGSAQSSLATAWPLAGVLSAGVALDERAGAAGAVLGAAHFFSAPLNGLAVGALTGSQIVSFSSTFVLYTLAGVVAGYAVRLVRQSDDTVARSRAREEVARTLHDGVLQTLAIVERRANDEQLSAMAREQERELRAFLAGTAGPVALGGAARRRRSRGERARTVQAGDVAAKLRSVAGRLEAVHGVRVDVVVAPDLPAMSALAAEALAGAVSEAVTNAGKHARASKVVVYAEPASDSGVFASVKDDGAGFDPASTPERIGLSQSIRGRVEAAGGRVELASSPGRGTEVRLWL